MKLIALALLTLPLFSQSQSKLAPDCTQGNIVFTGTGAWASFDNRPQSNNTGIPCAFWSLTYVAQSSVAAITIEIDGSPDNSTWTALATSSLIPSGRLEWNGQVSSVATYYPWIRVKVTYGSGSGTINAVLNGWRANGVTIGGGTGGGGSGSPNSATAFTSATSVLIPGAGTPNVIVECYDNSTPAKFKIQTNSESVSNTSPYNYTVTFASNQSGVCILNSSGGSASGAQVQAGAQYSMATYPDAGTNPVVGPLAPGGAVLGPVGILQSGGNAGAIGVVGNTGYPTLQTNTGYIMGPPSASFTSYALQLATAPQATGPMIVGGVGILTTGGTYASGGTSCTNGSQVVTYSGGGATTNATGTITVSGTVPVGLITITSPGAGYTSAPTTVQVTTCTGTTTITGSAIAAVSQITFGTQTGAGTQYVASVAPTFTGPVSSIAVPASNAYSGALSLFGSGSATLGNQTWSGGILMRGFGWSTGASASQPVDVIQYLVPLQGNPLTSAYAWSFQVNSGGFTQEMTLTSNGLLGLLNTENITIGGLTNTVTDGLQLWNTTASTSGSTLQYSPALHFQGTAWNTGSSASQIADWKVWEPTISGATVGSEIAYDHQENGAGYTNVANLDYTGRWTSISLTVSGASVVLSGLGASTGTPDALCLNGTVVTVNAALTCTVSNAKFKNSFRPLGRATSLLMRMRPVGFQYNAVAGRERWGFEARQVASVSPALADGWISPAGIRDQVRKPGDDPQSLDQNAILALTVKSLQEEIRLRNSQIAALTKRLAALEAKVKP